MRSLTRILLIWVAALAAWPAAVSAQSEGQYLTPFVPLRPQARQELARREARKLYGLGLLRQHEDRLVEATRTFEDALHLDPEAISIYRALIPLYVALGRTDDALTACQKTLDLDPGDYETWSLYARQLRNLARAKEARTALVRALACPGLADHV
jgi:tetratricopeptide (TPR) repeat protein